MNRRQILQIGILPLISSVGLTYAADSKTLESGIPKSFKNLYLKEDSNSVFYFFDFSCVPSAAYHIPMLTWSKSAPKPIRTRFIPIINPYDSDERLKRSTKAAVGYFAAEKISTNSNQLEKFITNVYNIRQLQNVPLDSDDLWIAAVKNSEMNLGRFIQATQAVSSQELKYAMNRFISYKVTESPTVGVAGQYSFNPNNTNGDPEMFFNILSGLSTQLILS
jgi:ribosomal protein L20